MRIFPPEYKGYYDKPILSADIPGAFDIEPSAYNFLFAKTTDYPDWIFTPIWGINKFGI